ncbi:anthranilate synthase component 1 [Ferrimonas balearica]|uniref:anthranilate synthase component 1 n=1 Tax=Ferrimonas balearica TaxID=44012 RepID=UPI001C953800|nr:anthranilate synthase component 1 [Ferrimonas balearica]MBY5979841.1 anthranilate synthase component 1 [Ferrimonas balearica]MBY6106616.1 anthranilate synthase component 1 [Ferrimonas balearica]MBY6224827.1 anthranilate synthase component 1 [Ferrimonas balearica]
MNPPLPVGHARTLTTAARYHSEPAEVFQALCGERPHTLLLESAEIESKAGLKSLLLIDAALELRCQGRDITLTALSVNGEQLLPFLADQLDGFQPRLQDNRLLLTVPALATGLDEDSRLKAPSPLTVLRTVQQAIQSDDALAESVLLAGSFAFDLVASVEPLPAVADGANTCPDYLFYLSETALVLDHQARTARLIGSVFGGDQSNELANDKRQRLAALVNRLEQPLAPLPKEMPEPRPVSVNQSDAEFCRIVEDLKEHVRAGDIFQVVPARRFSLPCPSPLAAYGRLRQLNPSPYMFFMRSDDFTLFGASPESALKYERVSNQVEIYPIAGTRKRGKHADGRIDHDLDSRIELGLRQDQKELSEHLMLVDLARNDVARISQPGTRRVADLLKVDRYSHVMHLVSRVTGQLRDDLDALHAYQACMNMGTLTGAPKVKAAQLLREAEGERRGSYGGAVGYLNGRGDMDTCIVIRSALVAEGIAHVQAGAGVVYDSDPQSEADETRNKAQAVIRAIGGEA